MNKVEFVTVRSYARQVVFYALRGNVDIAFQLISKFMNDNDVDPIGKAILDSIRDGIWDYLEVPDIYDSEVGDFDD